MFSKKQYIFVIFALSSLVITSLVFADASGITQADTYVTAANSDDSSGGSDTLLWATTDGDSDGNCNISQQIFMEWDLEDITDPNDINSAELTMTVRFFSGNSNAYNVALYKSDNSTNLEAITWNTKPSIGSLIETQSTSSTDGSKIIFSSTDLISYLKTQASTTDHKATFMIQLDPTGSCGGSNSQIFYSKEASGGRGPDLQILDVNAVTISNFSVGDSTWPVIAGIVALALAAVAGIGYGARRFNS